MKLSTDFVFLYKAANRNTFFMIQQSSIFNNFIFYVGYCKCFLIFKASNETAQRIIIKAKLFCISL